MGKTVRVVNSAGNTTGFVIDEHYVEYYTLLKNIEWEPKLEIDTEGEIVAKQGELPIVPIKEIYQAEYIKICKERFIQRDIESDLEEWKKRYSDKVLFLRGARQTGKTTELMKFAYNHYEQIIYINLALDADRETFHQYVVENTSLRYGMKGYCKARGLSPFCDEKESYETLTQLYQVYRQIGGYPDIVSSYIVSGDIRACMTKLENLLEVFTDESKRYFHNDNIDTITNWIKDSSKEHVSRNEVTSAISWLEYSGILDACDLYNNGNINDLLPNRRMYFKDCGLANCIASRTSLSQEAVEGMLTETFAYTELYRLCKKHIVKNERPCFSTYNNYELDFMLINQDDVVYGIEVKASNSTNPISLNVYLDKGFIVEGYMAGITRGGIREKIKTIPIYTVGVRFPYGGIQD